MKSIKPVYNPKKFLLSIGKDILNFIGAILVSCGVAGILFGGIWCIGLFGHYVLHLGAWIKPQSSTSEYILASACVLITAIVFTGFIIKGIISTINYFKDKWKESIDFYATYI